MCPVSWPERRRGPARRTRGRSTLPRTAGAALVVQRVSASLRGARGRASLLRLPGGGRRRGGPRAGSWAAAGPLHRQRFESSKSFFARWRCAAARSRPRARRCFATGGTLAGSALPAARPRRRGRRARSILRVDGDPVAAVRPPWRAPGTLGSIVALDVPRLTRRAEELANRLPAGRHRRSGSAVRVHARRDRHRCAARRTLDVAEWQRSRLGPSA